MSPAALATVIMASVAGGCSDDGDGSTAASYCDVMAEAEQAMSADLRSANPPDGQVPPDLDKIAARVLGDHLDELRRVEAVAPAEIADDFAVVMTQWERIAAGEQNSPDDEGLAAEARIAAYERQNCS